MTIVTIARVSGQLLIAGRDAAVAFARSPVASRVAVRRPGGADRIFIPTYVEHNGWIRFWLEHDPCWDEIADAIDESYWMTVSRRLIKQLDAG